jgi:dihydrofolate synthase / folylpolyglutamate synthase
MLVNAVRTRVFKEREDLADFILEHIPKLKEDSVLVVTSKIVALAEGRTANRENVTSKEKLIRAESTFAFPTKWVWLTLKDGFVVASAGIDESNADGKFILLPKDSYKAASALRKELMKRYGVKRLALIIPDSRTVPLRAGATGMAIGYAGMKGLRDYRGKKDIFGRPFKFERVGVADGLATAAMMAMGDGDEQQPLCVIEDARVDFVETVRRTELHIPLADDIYLPFLNKIPKKYLS